MLDFGQEKRAKSGSRGSEAAVQSSKAPAGLFKVQMQQSCSSRGSEAAVQSSKAPAELFKVQMQQSCSSRGSEAAVQSSNAAELRFNRLRRALGFAAFRA